MGLWRQYEKVEAMIVSGGGLFQLKGIPQDATPRRITVWLHEERASVAPFGAPDQTTMFTPERVAIEKLDGPSRAEITMKYNAAALHEVADCLGSASCTDDEDAARAACYKPVADKLLWFP